MKTVQSFACCMLLALASYAQKSDYSFREAYDIQVPAQLTISSSDGNIDVVPSNGSEIEVFYIVRRNDTVLQIDRKALEEELTLEVTHDQNSLKIKVKYPDDYWRTHFGNQIQVDFEIHTPKETACRLITSDGDISLTGLSGAQELKTSDGNISIAEAKGNISGKTSDGNVNVDKVRGMVEVATSDGNIELKNITGDISSSTSDGNITMYKLEGSTSSKTSDGHISFDGLTGSFTGVTSDGDIRGTFAELKNKLTARTSDGNIDITIPAKLGIDLDIKAESLNVPLENFSGKSGKKVIQGKANGGGIPITLSASDGRVSLASR